MNSIEMLSQFFGWCAVLNMATLIISALILTFFRAPILRLHTALFALEENDLKRLYIKFLGHYKLAIFIFNVAPYFALKIMA